MDRGKSINFLRGLEEFIEGNEKEDQTTVFEKSDTTSAINETDTHTPEPRDIPKKLNDIFSFENYESPKTSEINVDLKPIDDINKSHMDEDHFNDIFTSKDTIDVIYEKRVEKEEPAPIETAIHRKTEKKRILRNPISRSPDITQSSEWHTRAKKKEEIKSRRSGSSTFKERGAVEHKTLESSENNERRKSRSINFLDQMNKDEKDSNEPERNKEYAEKVKDIDREGSRRKDRKEDFSKDSKRSSLKTKIVKRKKREKEEKEKERSDSVLMNFLYIFEIFKWINIKDSDILLRFILAVILGLLVFGFIFSQLGLLFGF